MTHPSMERHHPAYSTCAYCPKVCRFSCPVSESTKNEATSAWGKMNAAYLVAEGARPLDEGAAHAIHACTGCGRCTEVCKHSNMVGAALVAARSESLDQGLSPKGVTSTLATFEAFSNPFGAELLPLVQARKPEGPVRHLLFPGCATLVKASDELDDALWVAEKVGAPAGVARESAQCCGAPLLATGAVDKFVAHANVVAHSLAAHAELVVLDPGCAHTFKVVYPQFGVKVKPAIRTLVEVVAEYVDHAPGSPLEGERVAYHDACKLGRGLGVYEPPRALLRRAYGTVGEAHSNRGQAECSGGGGLLPRTMPTVAVDIARRTGNHLAGRGETIVTACPTSRRMFERAGHPSVGIFAALRRWLERSNEGGGKR